MTEPRPIIFSGPMVRAILDGRKTQTRRVIIPQPEVQPVAGRFRVGNLLWVREKWKVHTWTEDGFLQVQYADGTASPFIETPEDKEDWFENIWIECSDECHDKGLAENKHGEYHWEVGQSPCRWRSPIYMPRWVSRILLKITDVRVQRVQEITDSDAIAEGIHTVDNTPERIYSGLNYPDVHRDIFMGVWDSLNAKRRYGWDTNPFVEAVTFEVLKP